MYAKLSLVAACAVVFSGLLLIACGAAPKLRPVQAGDFTLSGPFTHDNLTIFLIHGPDRLKGKTYLTLQEAMERKIVIVHETGNVNELSVENVSKNLDVYIQSGDIVKGGRQDRTIAVDFIVPPGSGRMPLSAFCVEHGRWTARAAEPSTQFASSSDAIAGRELKLAAKQKGAQGEVWQEVASNQVKLSRSAGAPAAASASPTSFQLTLETDAVRGHTEDYVKALQPAIDGNDDVIGYAFAINGKVNSADVYASHALFAKLWPKLLKSSAVEALAEMKKNQKFDPATAEAVAAFMADARAGKSTDKDVTARVRMVTRETETNVVFETRDRDAADGLLHENYVNKK